MTTQSKDTLDPAAMWRSALSTFVNASVEALGTWIAREYGRRTVVASVDIDISEPAIDDAAALLGVARSATVDEIRAAFRERIKVELTSGTFHDQAGDTTDERAQHLIAAKNALIEHATAGEGSNG